MDEQEEIKKAVLDRFNDLQPEIQEAIMDANYEKNLYDIAQKHKLNIEQMGQLEADTTLVLLGQTHPDDYANELAEDLNLPKEKIAEIVSDVNEKILKNIRELIKANFARDDEVEAAAEVPIPPYRENPINKAKDKLVGTPVVKAEPEHSLLKEQAPQSEYSAPKTASGIYKNAGIEMLDDTPLPVKKGSMSNIIASKLNTATIQKPVTSDYSAKKPTASADTVPLPPKNLPVKDPYHESIE